jgi:hypothetical protein
MGHPHPISPSPDLVWLFRTFCRYRRQGCPTHSWFSNEWDPRITASSKSHHRRPKSPLIRRVAQVGNSVFLLFKDDPVVPAKPPLKAKRGP